MKPKKTKIPSKAEQAKIMREHVKANFIQTFADTQKAILKLQDKLRLLQLWGEQL